MESRRLSSDVLTGACVTSAKSNGIKGVGALQSEPSTGKCRMLDSWNWAIYGLLSGSAGQLSQHLMLLLVVMQAAISCQ